MKLAVWYLRKRKVSVLLNFEVDSGRVKAKSRDVYIYDNTFKKGFIADLSSSEKFTINHIKE